MESARYIIIRDRLCNRLKFHEGSIIFMVMAIFDSCVL